MHGRQKLLTQQGMSLIELLQQVLKARHRKKYGQVKSLQYNTFVFLDVMTMHMF
jgi:hypothetical protein